MSLGSLISWKRRWLNSPGGSQMTLLSLLCSQKSLEIFLGMRVQTIPFRIPKGKTFLRKVSNERLGVSGKEKQHAAKTHTDIGVLWGLSECMERVQKAPQRAGPIDVCSIIHYQLKSISKLFRRTSFIGCRERWSWNGWDILCNSRHLINISWKLVSSEGEKKLPFLWTTFLENTLFKTNDSSYILHNFYSYLYIKQAEHKSMQELL